MTLGGSVRVLGAAVVSASLGLMGCAPSDPPPVSDKVQAYYDENVADKAAAVTSKALQVADFEEAAAKLRVATKPFTLTIIGDSTSYPKQGWVEVAAQNISQISQRRVIIRTWNLDTASYDPARVYGEGEPALTIWNGSAPGRDAAYSFHKVQQLMPAKPDMVIVNHGHNVTAPDTILNLTYEVAARAGGTAAVALVRQNPRAGDGAPVQAAKMQAVSRMAADMPGVEVIDAFDAFPANPSPWLSADGVHPNPEGYRAWADVALKKLGFV